VVACAATSMIMSDGLVAAMTLVVGSCSGMFDGSSCWASPVVKSELRLQLDLWQRCPMAGGPIVMVFIGVSLAYLLFKAHFQNRSCCAKSHLFGIDRHRLHEAVAAGSSLVVVRR
jgi:hypothetical protein